MMGRIVVGKSLISHHKEHIDEIVAVVAHEMGHFMKSHLPWGLVVDTAYMVVFGSIL